MINLAGLAYNHCIALHRRYYKLFGKYARKYAMTHHFVKLKRTKRFSYLKLLDAQALENIVFRIDYAYQRFFADFKRKVKCSAPKFRKIRKYKSFTLRQKNWRLDEAAHAIKICGHWYKYFWSRNIQGKVKTITVKRDAAGNMYIYIVTDCQLENIKPRTGKSVGFDFGLKRFLTGSDGYDIDSPDFFKLNYKNIRRKSRKLSLTQKTSHNHERARLDLARAYRKMHNQRKDFHYKTARTLCGKYAVICLETLNLKGMRKRWGRKINSLSFCGFLLILEYEALKFGTQIVFIDRWYPSSQLCHVCGYKNPEVKNLRVREWDCPACGSHHDRDRNAAINIFRAGCRPMQEDS